MESVQTLHTLFRGWPRSVDDRVEPPQAADLTIVVSGALYLLAVNFDPHDGQGCVQRVFRRAGQSTSAHGFDPRLIGFPVTVALSDFSPRPRPDSSSRTCRAFFWASQKGRPQGVVGEKPDIPKRPERPAIRAQEFQSKRPVSPALSRPPWDADTPSIRSALRSE